MNKWKTIIMSDLHLGARQSQTEKIIKFLDKNESEILILNGDIIDGWALKKWWKMEKRLFKSISKIYEKK
jgi:UDP-2,3-diacylglucosamine pyrophosphatase LpxH